MPDSKLIRLYMRSGNIGLSELPANFSRKWLLKAGDMNLFYDKNLLLDYQSILKRHLVVKKKNHHMDGVREDPLTPGPEGVRVLI